MPTKADHIRPNAPKQRTDPQTTPPEKSQANTSAPVAIDAERMTPANVLYLQRTAGNRAVQQALQRKDETSTPQFGPSDPHNVIADLHPTMQAKVRALIEAAHQRGLDVRVNQGMRTIAEQDALYAQGRTTKGSIVTNAKGGQSYHNYGIAVDVIFNGKDPWGAKHDWKALGAAGQEAGLEWGGAWKSFVDLPHFQLPGIKLSSLQSWFAKGGMDNVWKKITEANGETTETPHTESSPPVSAVSDTPASTGAAQTGVVTASALNVRKGPSAQSVKVGLLQNGAAVVVTGHQGDWLKIRYQGSAAYVNGSYVRLNGQGSNGGASAHGAPAGSSPAQPEHGLLNEVVEAGESVIDWGKDALNDISSWVGGLFGPEKPPAPKPSPSPTPKPGPSQPQTGAQGDLPALGSLSKKYESSGNPGTVSSGVGDPGGVSYGAYQMTSKPDGGTVASFVKSDVAKAWAGEFSGLTPGSSDFSKKWKEIAKREPDAFLAAQHDYIKATHYDPQVKKLSKNGLDIAGRSRALQNVVWSTSVQHGANTSLIIKALGGADAASLSDEEIIRRIYAERGRKDASGVLVHFSKCSKEVQAGVAKRFQNELNDALKMLQQEKK